MRQTSAEIFNENLRRFVNRLDDHDKKQQAHVACKGHRGDSCNNIESSEERIKRFKRRLRNHNEGVISA